MNKNTPDPTRLAVTVTVLCLALLFFSVVGLLAIDAPAYASTPAPSLQDTTTPTDTPIPPTDTPVPPTATPIPPTDTPVPPTATPVPPTATPIPPTATPKPHPTATPTPTNPPAATSTPTPESGQTPTATATTIASPTGTLTVGATTTPTNNIIIGGTTPAPSPSTTPITPTPSPIATAANASPLSAITPTAGTATTKSQEDGGAGMSTGIIGALGTIALAAAVLIGIAWRKNQFGTFFPFGKNRPMLPTPPQTPPLALPAQGVQFSSQAPYSQAYAPGVDDSTLALWPQPGHSPVPVTSSSDLNPLATDFLHIMGTNAEQISPALNISANSLLDTSPRLPELQAQQQFSGPINLQSDVHLQAIMRQAQTGIFVVPNRERVKQPADDAGL